MSEQNLFSDSVLKINLPEKPFCKGHIQVKFNSQKKFEDRDDKEIEEMFFSGSYSASALFELLGAHGTNIILTEFDNEETKLDVLSRFEGDKLNFTWTPIAITPLEIADTAKSIKDNIDMIKWQIEHPEEGKKEYAIEKKIEEIKEKKTDSGEVKVNYLLKSLNRRL
jgi:hypothetical protein